VFYKPNFGILTGFFIFVNLAQRILGVHRGVYAQVRMGQMDLG